METVYGSRPHRDPFPSAMAFDWIARWGCVRSSSGRRRTVLYRGRATPGRRRRPTLLHLCRARRWMNSYVANASIATRSAIESCGAVAADLKHQLLTFMTIPILSNLFIIHMFISEVFIVIDLR